MRRAKHFIDMSWRPGELWFDVDVPWFRERPRSLGALAVAGGAIDLPRFDTGLEASRRRRFAAEAARKRRFATRTVPAAAVVIGSSVVLPLAALRQRGVSQVVEQVEVLVVHPDTPDRERVRAALGGHRDDPVVAVGDQILRLRPHS